MPVAYQIDINGHIVSTRGFGDVFDKELLQHNEDLKADPNFDPNFNHLLDFTEVTNNDVKSETIYEIARNIIFNLISHRAIIIKPDLQYGLARMFQNMRELEDKNIRIFLDINEAKKWLGLVD